MFGTLEKLKDVKSAVFKVPNVEVWLPPNYDSSIKHPVVYMQDGQSIFDPSKSWTKHAWKVDESMTRLIKDGVIPPSIVVSIWHHQETRNTDYLPQKVFDLFPDDFKQTLTSNGKELIKSDAYLQFMVKELKPFIDANYATSQASKDTFVVGSSMGALIALYGLCKYSTVFGGVGCLSAHWALVLDAMEQHIAPKAFEHYIANHLPSPNRHKLYVDMGTGFFDNRNLETHHRISSIVKAKGYTAKNWQSEVFEEHTHHEKCWAERLPDVITFLLGR